jgi:S1-C subfamily serine protease
MSGGPLLDRQGAVVGITSQPVTTDGGSGLAAVIPIDRARQVAEEILAYGKVLYPWLGLSGDDLDPGTAARYGVERGAVVRTVEPDGPARRSGLQVEDVVTAVDAAPIATAGELTMLVRRHAPGDRVALSVVRSRTTRIVTVRLDRASNNAPTP